MTASIVGDSASVITGAYSGTGNKAGFGGTAGGTVTFDDFTFSKSHIDDPACATCGNDGAVSTCSGCITNTNPTHGFDLSITGVANDTCTNCTSLFNGLHICDQYADIAIGSGTGCRWYFNCTSPGHVCCDVLTSCPGSCELRIYKDFGNNHYYLDVVLGHCTAFGFNQIATFQYDFGTTQPDCRDISNLTIPYLTQTGSTACVFSGATVKVTANV